MTIPPPARGWLFATLAGLSLTVAACSSALDTAMISQDRAAADLTDGSTSLTPGQVVQPIQVPGDSRQGTISALSDPAHPDLPAPLVDLADIGSGGPPPDGIAPLDAPVFEQAIEVDWLAADEAVIVVDLGGDARAYPIQVLTWHEIVNDTFGDVPVTVTYCPLCDSAIVGELTGLQLEFLPTSTVSWDDFRASHPKGLVLSRDTGFSRPYGQNPYAGYDNPDGDPFLFDGEVDPRLRAQTRVVAVRGEDATVAIVQDWLLDQGVAEVDLDGRALVVLLEPGVASALEQPEIGEGRDVGATGVFVPEGGGHELTFSPSPNGIGFMDDQTGSVWSILGGAVEGPRGANSWRRSNTSTPSGSR